MTIAVDYDVKHIFKQKTTKLDGALRCKYFRLSVISLSYHLAKYRTIVIPVEKSRYARFSFLYMHNRTFYYVRVNKDLYMEQMNHSVVIKLKISDFMLTFTGISPCFAAK